MYHKDSINRIKYKYKFNSNKVKQNRIKYDLMQNSTRKEKT